MTPFLVILVPGFVPEIFLVTLMQFGTTSGSSRDPTFPTCTRSTGNSVLRQLLRHGSSCRPRTRKVVGSLGSSWSKSSGSPDASTLSSTTRLSGGSAR